MSSITLVTNDTKPILGFAKHNNGFKQMPISGFKEVGEELERLRQELGELRLDLQVVAKAVGVEAQLDAARSERQLHKTETQAAIKRLDERLGAL